MTLDARLQVPVAAALREIQAPIRDRLECVPAEMWRIVQADVAIVEAANAHLRGMRGKLFRPTLLLLASAVEDAPEARAVPLAAVAELVHLTSVVHDASVEHGVSLFLSIENTRKGAATNAVQIAQILGEKYL